MKRAACATLAALLLAACGGGSSSSEDGDENVSWSFSFVSSTCSCRGCSCGSCCCGGATVRVSGKALEAEAAPWIVGEATPLAEAAPPTDPAAIEEAMALAPRAVAVIDAAFVPGGVAALLRGRSGETGIALLGSAPEPAVLMPADSRRVLLVSEDPTVVCIHLCGETALQAARTRD